MKHINKYILIIFSVLLIQLSSCNFLDIVPDDTTTLDDAFKNETTLDEFVFSCYSYIPNYTNFRQNFGLVVSNESVASSHWGTQWFPNLQLQQGLYSSSKPVIDIWRNTYQGIKQCHLYFNNVDKVTPVRMSQSQFDKKKKEWTSEEKFLLAYYHYILLQNYGPICIVSSEIDVVNGKDDDLFLHRKPYDECVEAIGKMFDDAMIDLPISVSPADYGRATKVAAQSLKSRMYLYAASPLFNGNSEYYSDFKGKDGTHLISQIYDKEKWKKAMDETKKAIEMAQQAGHELYKYTAKSGLSDFDQAIANTRYTMLDKWNKELLWGYSGYKEASNLSNSYQAHVISRGFTRSKPPYGAIGASMDAVEIFYSKNGIPADKDPSFDWEKRMTIAAGDSTILLHRNREPRFYACIGFDRGKYEINDKTYTLKMKFKEKHGCDKVDDDHLYSGYAIKKGVHPSSKAEEGRKLALAVYPYPLIRLGELYLNYAEASANYNGSLDADGLKFINAIRTKAGIQNFEKAFGGIKGKELVNAVQRERMIELVFEAHWLYDLKRWKRAEEVLMPLSKGMRGLNRSGKTNEEFYKETLLNQRPFVFERKNHLHPINNVDITVNANLVQNPGW